MLEIRDLSVSYGQHRALESAALHVSPGEIVVILGANGAGKSTLLKALCGISEGRVTGSALLDGEEILGARPDRIVEAGLSLVPEGRGIFGDLTVQENLTLGAYPTRARDDETGNLDRVLSLFPKLAERRRQTVRTMSGGEQQMVAIGRAMMSNPQVLALDEPSLGLSPLLCKDLFQSLLAVKAAGVGVLLVEQNAKQSLRIADRGYLLENGEIVNEDKADALARDPAVQRAYLGAGGGQAAPHQPEAAPRPAATPRRPSGPSASEIAAAALDRVGTASRPPAARPPARPAAEAAGPPDTPDTKPAPEGPASRLPDVNDLVARASAQSSRRPGAPARPAPPAARRDEPPRRVAPTGTEPDTGDRLQAVLDEIEAAARRAETYRSRDRRR
ncbi:ABC transporter ATP-binding protein [Psychromarinibacter sp. C21-152]|uniref:ABC transporter ATP-binding protein n=1 Tax=Psychromarinibacter sediminicola TaxID=3033385 RepID=A0AAE3NY83_9RHOB|nr:ABC transporter ATP-binding protein [Psychromarinibacter sediminicola]MDF0602852.1 ABC transporter ATP-binding protein [Psychromarinibacter sediminicola]